MQVVCKTIYFAAVLSLGLLAFKSVIAQSINLPDYPVALGVIRDVKDITYDDGVRDQVKDVMAKSTIHCVDDLLHSGSTWEVE